MRAFTGTFRRLGLNLEAIKRHIRDLMSRFVTNIKAQTALGLGPGQVVSLPPDYA